MKKEEIIEKILNDLKNTGSNINYVKELKKSSLEYLKKDISLSEVMDNIAKNFIEQTASFLNSKNDYDVNYISGISSCIYFPSFDDSGEVKLKFIGGDRSRNFDLKVNENTMFDIASITKLFTLILLFELDELKLENGKKLLNLNDKIADINPDFKELEDFTFNDLIRMHGELYTNGNIALATNQTEAYKILKTLYLKSNSREENKYTDFGAIVIGDTIEKIFSSKLAIKTTFANIMKIFLIDKLGLNNTRFNPVSENISGNGDLMSVHDPKAKVLGGAVGSAGIFTTSDDLAKLAKNLYSVNFLTSKKNNYIINKEHLARLGEITFPNSKQCNKGNLGIYVKHPLGFDKTFTPSEFSNNSFSHQGWTGSLATFDPNNLIHQNILVNAIYESDNKDLVRNDKPIGFGVAFDEYLKQMTINTMIMYIAKKYYNNYCGVKENIDVKHEINKISAR